MTLSAAASALLRTGRASAAGVIVNEHTLDEAAVRRHVDVLGRTFEFIHHDDLLDRLSRRRPRPFCLVTFDDGKRSGYTQAAPELERLGVPAVFYLATGFVGGDAPLWFDRYEALLAALGFAPPGLDRDTVIRLPLEDVVRRLDRACDLYGVFVDMNDDDIAPMQWGEARDLARRGFTIGAHGVTHAVLTRERTGESLREIGQSMADVSRELGVPCRTFAFPNGNYTERLVRHAVACGAETVMTTEPMWVDGHARPWQLPRVQLFAGQGTVRIALKLAAASRQLLVNPDGTGRAYRRVAARRGRS